MNVMKKMIIFLVLFLLISFSTSIAAENNWELYQKLDYKSVEGENPAELWENSESDSIIDTALVYKKVNLGGPILKSYNRFAKNHEVAEHNKNEEYQEKNKTFYPFNRYIKIIYNGFDSKNNIHLKVYENYINNRKEMYSDINRKANLIDDETHKEVFEKEKERLNIKNMAKMKDVFIKSSFLGSEFSFEFNKNYKEYIVSSDKVIIFDNSLIPNFKININSDNSTINIKIVD
jgi:hypothetical protein